MSDQTTTYNELTTEQQRQILTGRITGWESELFGHRSDIKRFQALIDQGVGNENDQRSYAEALDLAQRSIDVLTVSVDLAKQERDAL